MLLHLHYGLQVLHQLHSVIVVPVSARRVVPNDDLPLGLRGQQGLLKRCQLRPPVLLPEAA